MLFFVLAGTLVEPWWNRVEPYLRQPRTTPEPIWAETPKLSAVGEKQGRAVELSTLETSLPTSSSHNISANLELNPQVTLFPAREGVRENPVRVLAPGQRHQHTPKD